MYALTPAHGASAADDMVVEPEDTFFAKQPPAHGGAAAVPPVDLRALYNGSAAKAAALLDSGESEPGAPKAAEMRDEEPNAPTTKEEEDLPASEEQDSTEEPVAPTTTGDDDEDRPASGPHSNDDGEEESSGSSSDDENPVSKEQWNWLRDAVVLHGKKFPEDGKDKAGDGCVNLIMQFIHCRKYGTFSNWTLHYNFLTEALYEVVDVPAHRQGRTKCDVADADLFQEFMRLWMPPEWRLDEATANKLNRHVNDPVIPPPPGVGLRPPNVDLLQRSSALASVARLPGGGTHEQRVLAYMQGKHAPTLDDDDPDRLLTAPQELLPRESLIKRAGFYLALDEPPSAAERRAAILVQPNDVDLCYPAGRRLRGDVDLPPPATPLKFPTGPPTVPGGGLPVDFMIGGGGGGGGGAAGCRCCNGEGGEPADGAADDEDVIMCSQCGEAEPTDDDEDEEDEEDEEEPELEDAERDGDGEAANKCEDMVVDDEHEEEVADTGPEGAGATKQASDPSADEGSVPMAVEPETHMGSALLHEPFEGEADERAAAGVGVGADAGADASADGELAGTDDEATGAEQVEYKEPQHDPIPHDETSTPAYLPKDKDGPLHFCERVLIRDIEGEHQDYNLLRGLATRWHAPNDADKTGTYEISVDNNDFCIRVAPENLMRAHSYDYKTEAARKQFKARMFDPILRKSNGEPLKTDFRQLTMPSTNHEVMPPQFAVLASLIPVASEEIEKSGEVERKVVDPQEWAKGLNLKLPTDKKDFADITDVVTSVENKLIWRMLPNTIRSVMTALIESGKLDWDDILEDGNLFWDISYTERPEWPEPDRWHQTIVNFLLQMAWERSIDLHQPLYPTARMQVLRDLFLGEWSMRSHRVGMQMWKHYFPDKMPAAEEDDLPHDVLPMEAQLERTSPADLSLYEIQRNANILANQLKLRELFGDDHVAEGAARPKPKAKSRASSSSTAAAAAAPSRSSARARPKVSYVEQKKKPKARGRGASDDDDDDDDDASDDDAAGSGDEFEEDSDDEGGSGADSSDEYADDEDDDEGGGGGGKQRAMSKAEGKKPKAPKKGKSAAGGGGKGKGKGKAAGAGTGGGKTKVVRGGNRCASVPFGGEGFRCPSSGKFFPSAEKALANAKEKHGHSGEREVDADGKSPCLWCKQKILVVFASNPNRINPATLSRHEALHVKGTPLRQAFVCPHPGCVEAFGKDADKAWKHAWEEHGIARDKTRCLWEDCSQGMRDAEAKEHRFRKPSAYKEHEAAHTGIFPFNCSCGGYSCLKKKDLETHQRGAKCPLGLPPKVASSGN